MQEIRSDNIPQKPSMSPLLRGELQNYLSQLESHVFTKDMQRFDTTISRLLDCIRVLLEEN